MISVARAHALIDEHAGLRKLAFDAVKPRVLTHLRSAEDALRSIKTAAEARTFHPALLRHLMEP